MQSLLGWNTWLGMFFHCKCPKLDINWLWKCVGIPAAWPLLGSRHIWGWNRLWQHDLCHCHFQPTQRYQRGWEHQETQARGAGDWGEWQQEQKIQNGIALPSVVAIRSQGSSVEVKTDTVFLTTQLYWTFLWMTSQENVLVWNNLKVQENWTVHQAFVLIFCKEFV